MRRVLRRRLVSGAVFTLGAGLLGGLIGVTISRVDDEPPTSITLFAVCGGMVAGALMAYCEDVLVPRWTRHLSFAGLTARRLTFHFLSIGLVVVLINTVRLVLLEGRTPADALLFFLADTGTRDLLVSLAAAAVFTTGFQVFRLHSLSEIGQLLSGRYHYPLEEQRVFLFADLAKSTSLAERLGPLRYSRLIQDLFGEISEVVVAWGGTVYQYLGDGVVVSWNRSKGLDGAACVRCFLDMSDALAHRADHFEQEYGAAVVLRGGIHWGSVVGTRVGGVRSEMAFHGDPLNVTARLQSLCATHNAELLISGATRELIPTPQDVRFESVGELQLRGRTEGLEVYAVRRVTRRVS